MDAGRELDALIAEKVMGYRLLWAHKAWSTEDWLTADYPTEQNTMAIVTDENWEPGKSYPKYLVIPHYSTDIAAAWQVVEAMNNKHWEFAMDGLRAWMAVFYDPNAARKAREWPALGWSHAPTAPLAICLAALRAVE